MALSFLGKKKILLEILRVNQHPCLPAFWQSPGSAFPFREVGGEEGGRWRITGHRSAQETWHLPGEWVGVGTCSFWRNTWLRAVVPTAGRGRHGRLEEQQICLREEEMASRQRSHLRFPPLPLQGTGLHLRKCYRVWRVPRGKKKRELFKLMLQKKIKIKKGLS